MRKLSLMCAKYLIITTLVVLLFNTSGCSTTALVKSVLSSVAGQGPSASLSVDVGQKEIARGATVGASTSIAQDTKVDKIEAKKDVKLDQSSKKKDQKTEIGEVQGNVTVHQGPSIPELLLLGLGWPLWILFLIYIVFKKRRGE